MAKRERGCSGLRDIQVGPKFYVASSSLLAASFLTKDPHLESGCLSVCQLGSEGIVGSEGGSWCSDHLAQVRPQL